MKHPLSTFKYCPRCGSAHFKAHDEKSNRCAACEFIYYFNSSAAVVAFILNERNELLVARRAQDPAQGTLDLPGGFVDTAETAEEGIAREVLEETGLLVEEVKYQFSLPNIYLYSSFEVHTLDLFFLCQTSQTKQLKAMDDVSELFFLPLGDIDAEAFGLPSIQKGVRRFIQTY